MKNIIGIFIVTLLILSAVLPALGNMNEIKDFDFVNMQSPTVEWEKTFGGEEYDLIYCIQETNEGGYIAVGTYTESDDPYEWMLKLDSEGNEEWSNLYIEETWSEGGMPTFVQQTRDGGYIASTYQWEDDVHNDMGYYIGALYKVDASGTTEWRQRYYVGDEEPIITVPWVVYEVADGYITVGYVTYSDDSLDAMLMKTDSTGEIEWRKIYSFWDGDSAGRSMCFTNDGGYLIAGTAIDNNEDFFHMIKTDANGNAEWYKTFGGPKGDASYSRNCYQTSDGGYIINGNTKNYGAGSDDLWLIKTDSSGNMEWNKTYGGTKSEVTWSMCNTNDGGYAIIATTNYGGFSGTKDDALLIKTDNDGNAEWSETYGGSNRDRGYYVSQTNDGGYIISGRTESIGAGGSDGWIMKISSFENQRPNKPATPTGPSNGEPDIEYTFSTSTSDPDGDSLQYMWDWGDGNYSDVLDTVEATYSWTYKDNFEVKVKAIDGHGGESDWSEPLAFSTPKIKNIDQYPIIIQKILERFPFLRFLIG